MCNHMNTSICVRKQLSSFPDSLSPTHIRNTREVMTIFLSDFCGYFCLEFVLNNFSSETTEWKWHVDYVPWKSDNVQLRHVKL